MIYVLGSINMDLVIRSASLPRQGETVIGSGFFINHGGKGANQAVAAAKSGADVAMIGAVGDDAFGDQALESLGHHSINTSHVFRLGHPTGVASIWITDRDNRIIIDPGANAYLTTCMVDHGLAHATENDTLIVQYEIDPLIVGYGLHQAKSKGMTTLFNPAPMGPLSDTILENTDILCANDLEMKAINQTLSGQLPMIIINTHGSKGVSFETNGSITRIDAYDVTARDTTAAGDTFIGAFIAEYTRLRSLEKAIRYANAAAAISVTRDGAQKSIPTREEINRFQGGDHS